MSTRKNQSGGKADAISTGALETLARPTKKKKYVVVARNLFALTVTDEQLAHLSRLLPAHDATKIDDQHPDAVCFNSVARVTVATTEESENGTQDRPAISFVVPVALHPVEDSIGCIIGGEGIVFDKSFLPAEEMRALRDRLAIDNEQRGLIAPAELFSDQSKEKRKSQPLPVQLAQPTFMECRSAVHAISDARDGANWGEVAGALALLHQPEKGSHQVRFEPNHLMLTWWGKAPADVTPLRNELSKLEFDAAVTFNVALAGILHDPKARWTVSLDDIIKLIGRDTDARRSTKARQEWRHKVWRWLVIFDSWAVIGARPGRWKEPAPRGEKRALMPTEKLISRDPLLRIVGTREAEQGSFDKSEPPKEISIVPGEWLMEFHGNREILAEFGDVLSIASIARGKPSGAWAACAGFMLQQLWREEASRAERKRVSRGGETKEETLVFRAFTRRELLSGTLRSEHDIQELLLDPKSGHRAREYWKGAVKELKAKGVIGFYQEGKEPPGNDWRETWLDQPLYIRPKDQRMNDALEISHSASKARARGRSSKRAKKE